MFLGSPPKTEEPVSYIGPSFVAIDNHPEGLHYNACLWVGGDGTDGRWGHNVQFTFTIEHGNRVSTAMLAVLLSRQADALSRMFGELVGTVMIRSYIESIMGRCLDRPYAADELCDRFSREVLV